MNSFSERIGKKSITNIIQKEGIDQPLKNALWNDLTLCYWEQIIEDKLTSHRNGKTIVSLLSRLWVHYYKKLIDEQPNYFSTILKHIKADFFSCNWYEIYDLLEFIINNYEQAEEDNTNNIFIEECNLTLEKNFSAYRFINTIFSEITSNEELESIEMHY